MDIVDELKLMNHFVDPRPRMTIALAIDEIEKCRAEIIALNEKIDALERHWE